MNQRLVAFLAIAIFTCGAAQAGVLYQDQMTDGTNWAANVGGSGDSHYTFNYNYALHGIPEAPNSEAGDAPTAQASSSRQIKMVRRRLSFSLSTRSGKILVAITR